MKTENYSFEGFRLTIRRPPAGPAQIQLYFEGRPQTLTPHEARTLELLVRHRGDYVGTNTLAREVCGDELADETNIHVAIRGLRRIFRDPVKDGQYIQNERRKGYRFIKAVEESPDDDSDEAPVRRPAADKSGDDAPTFDDPPPAEETTSMRAGEAAAATAAAPPVNADDVVAGDLKDQAVGFRELWASAGKLMRWVICVGVLATAAVSAVVIIREWQNINAGTTAGESVDARGPQSINLGYVSIPQLFMLLIALGYVLPGPHQLAEDFRTAAGYDNPRDADDARYIAEKSLGRYTIYWRGILAFWFLLYCCLVLIEPGESESNPTRDILTTLFNNLGTAMFVLCYNVLNRPVEIKAGKREISDTPWLSGSIALTVIFLLVEIFAWKFFPTERERLLYVCGLVSGVAGAIGMALYTGRLQSKFLGPSSWLVIALYSYTAIQPLFIFLVSVPKGNQVFAKTTVTLIAVVLINIALILKCLLYLYVALLFKSGNLLFYFVKVRRTYLNVDRERREFRKFLKQES